MILEDPDTTMDVDTVGTISGTVVDAHTGDPLHKATVTVGDLSAVTNDSGRYTIDDAPLGHNAVIAKAEDFVPVVYKNLIFCGDRTVNLSLNRATGY